MPDAVTQLLLCRWGPARQVPRVGAQEREGTLPSGSPLWTSGLPPGARRRSDRWPSGTASRGHCLGACLGKRGAEVTWGLEQGPWPTSSLPRGLPSACFHLILSPLSLTKHEIYPFGFAHFNRYLSTKVHLSHILDHSRCSISLYFSMQIFKSPPIPFITCKTL